MIEIKIPVKLEEWKCISAEPGPNYVIKENNMQETWRMILSSRPNIIAAPVYGSAKKGKINFVLRNDEKELDALTRLLADLNLIRLNDPTFTNQIYMNCLKYTMMVRVAPEWHILDCYLIRGLNFLCTSGPHDAVKYKFIKRVRHVAIQLEAKSLTIERPEQYSWGDEVKVLPRLKHGTIASTRSRFDSSLDDYWRRLHGYILPPTAGSETVKVSFQFCGDRDYPKCCVLKRQNPIKEEELSSKEQDIIIGVFLTELRTKMADFVSNNEAAVQAE